VENAQKFSLTLKAVDQKDSRTRDFWIDSWGSSFQNEDELFVEMKLLLPSLFLVLALMLSSCETNNSRKSQASSSGSTARLPGPNPQQAFQIGIQRGRSDRKRGLAPFPARHDARVPLRSRPEFARGYDRGYREAGSVVVRVPVPSPRFGRPVPRIRF
jgi:hypothetical protein